MSYILEALKKSDSARRRGEVPGLHDPQPPTAFAKGSRSWLWVGVSVAAALLGAAVIGALWLWRPTDEPRPPQPRPAKAQPQRPRPPHPQKPAPKPAVKRPEPKISAPPIIKKAAPPVKAKTVVVKPPLLPALKSSKAPALNSAKAYIARAWSRLDKGLYTQALADLERALTLQPTNAEAWFARGWAHEKTGAEPTAIADYTHAIDTKPDYAAALFSRGYLRLYNGDAQGAVMDFVRTQGVAKNRSLRNYSRLWLYLSRVRAGRDGKTRLADDIRGEDLTPWPGPLIRYIVGRTDKTSVLRAIENASKTIKPSRKERRVTGYYFLAMFSLFTNANTRARAYFEKTLATGAVDFRQYDAARRELNAMSGEGKR